MLLSILISVLKVAGIVVLVLLGLILLILLTVLLVPVRYSFDIRKPEEPEALYKADVTWLLSLIHFSLTGKNQDMSYSLRAAWLKFPKETDKEEEEEEALTGAAEPLPPPAPEESAVLEAEPGKEETSDIEEPGKEEKPDIEEPGKEEKPDIEEAEEEIAIEETGTDQEVTETDEGEPAVRPSPEEKKEPITDRLTGKLNRVIAKIQSLTESFKEKREQLESMELDVCIPFSIRILKRVIKHILPRRLEGEAAFGSDDPVTTGKVTSAAAVLYPIYGKTFSFEPHFDKEILTADCRGKGRMRLGFFAIIIIQVLLKKQMRTLIFKALRK